MSEILNQPIATPCPAGWSKKHKWRFDSSRQRAACYKCMMMVRIADPDIDRYFVQIRGLHDRMDALRKLVEEARKA